MAVKAAVAAVIGVVALAALVLGLSSRDRNEPAAPLRSFVGSVSDRVPESSLRESSGPADGSAATEVDDPAADDVASRTPDDHLPPLTERAFVPQRLVVRFHSDVSQADKRRVRSVIGAELLRRLPMPGAEVVSLTRDAEVAVAARQLGAHPEVAYAEPDFVYSVSAMLPNDPRFPSLWGLQSATNTDIDAPEAWSVTTGASSVRIGVVDTGVAYDHPDLAPNVWVNAAEQAANGIDDDGNGYVDDARGWDWVGRDNDALDLHGHGTHVAGTIAAQGNNGTAVTGVAWDAALVPLRVLDADGSGTSSSIASAFSYAGKLGLDVVNASLGGPSFSQAVLDSIRSSPQTLFVIAAGNEAANNDSVASYPCNYEVANILCVAATTQSDALASYSNYGASSVDLAAPGSDILSTLPKTETRLREGFESGFSERWVASGTVPPWGISSDAQGNYLADSPGGPYLPGTNSAISSKDRLDLSGARGCRLRYALRLDTERNRDLLIVEASEDGAVWSRLGSASGSTQGGWTEMSSDLTSFDGRRPYVRFRLTSDDNTTVGAGADIDDVEVRCIGTVYSGSEVGTFSGTSMAAPHAAGAAAVLKSAAPGLDPGALKTVLMDGVVTTPALAGRTVAGGRLNLARSLALVAPLPSDAVPIAPDDPVATSAPTPEPSFTQSEQVPVAPETDPTLTPTPSPSGEDPPAAAPSPSDDPIAAQRTIRLSLRKHLVARGSVASSDGRCRSGARIVIKRKGVRIGATRTDPAGVFRFRTKDRTGRYAAIVAANQRCGRAVARARHRHASNASAISEQEESVTARGTCWTYSDPERRLADLVASSRAANGVDGLRLDPELSAVARLHAEEMRRSDALFHTPSTILRQRVTGWSELGENIGAGSGPEGLHESFMASTSHKDNIVHPRFRTIGVGVVTDGGMMWVSVLFQGGAGDPGTTLTMPGC